MCSNTCTKINCQARIPSVLQPLTSPIHPKLSQVTTSTETPLTCSARRFPLHKKREETTCLWSSGNAFVFLLLPFESTGLLCFSLCKLRRLVVFERYVKENGGSRVECCETLSVLLVTLACHCPLNVTSSRAQLQGFKKHSFLLYQNTQLPGTLKD